MTIIVNDIEELPLVAPKIIKFIGDYRIVLFVAPMGTGKTTLINALCNYLQVSDQPSSPTFSIVNEYSSNVGPIYHFDFYRIKNEQEAYDLGYEDYFYSGSYCFVEWPEKIPTLMPDEFVVIKITVGSDGQRVLNLEKDWPK
ncbi:tRNA (adenosine(37)-N6)-threonylcarbamoyltransferase complex ATPase subunit type 1 TsaE [Olivibacter sp. SDN3]|uniref:tRNA (adenosine(37)-N6)-threonylcarbamoyltransferase complex ATPase subunit type 1 TsaE n=1 Tax=Olivibacter sp. SDN3 TaxID=2764720 RepID=UPI0016515F20|nr:tRNA (adenosine(37)-N6)-threonylcarbamoyltransferase complex ATPase subunit type 1 TsaE [Olivibacter sp. SDN3]QNL51332.1 tRNA (adenosine(37)-N6)-threonylcarbamoyltransferase complex ATPase subunit type 1 TsaE [Olivibacter sp. SDN3]